LVRRHDLGYTFRHDLGYSFVGRYALAKRDGGRGAAKVCECRDGKRDKFLSAVWDAWDQSQDRI